MKNRLLYFLFILIFPQIDAQKFNVEKIGKDLVFDEGSHFQENTFDKKYLLIEDFFSNPENPDKKYARVLTEKGWGIIDENGKDKIDPDLYYIGSFLNGIAIIEYFPQKKPEASRKCYGLINYEGKIITPSCFYEMQISLDGREEDGFTLLQDREYFIVKNKNLKGVYTNKGRVLIPEKYESIQLNGQYFICKSGIYRFDIYNKDGQLLQTVNNALSIETVNNFLIVRGPDNYVLDMNTNKIHLKNQFDYIQSINSKKEISTKLIMIGTRYEKHEDGRIAYDKPTDFFYINDSAEIVYHKDYPKTVKIYRDEIVQAENPEKKSVALLDHEGKVLHSYTDREFNTYIDLSSTGYQDEHSIQENLKKYYGLWSLFHYNIDKTGFVHHIIRKKNVKNNLNFIINKKTGEIVLKIKGFLSSPFIVANYLGGQLNDGSFIMDFHENSIKRQSEKQYFEAVGEKTLLIEDGRYYFTDEKFNKRPEQGFENVYKVEKTSYFLVSNENYWEAVDQQGIMIRHFDYLNTTYHRYSDDNKIFFWDDKKMESVQSKNMKTIFKFNFKNNQKIFISNSGIYTIYPEGNGIDHLIIDNYGNAVKIKHGQHLY